MNKYTFKRETLVISIECENEQTFEKLIKEILKNSKKFDY